MKGWVLLKLRADPQTEHACVELSKLDMDTSASGVSRVKTNLQMSTIKAYCSEDVNINWRENFGAKMCVTTFLSSVQRHNLPRLSSQATPEARC